MDSRPNSIGLQGLKPMFSDLRMSRLKPRPTKIIYMITFSPRAPPESGGLGLLIREDDANSRAIFLGFGIDSHDIASKAECSVRHSPDSGIIELDLQFGLQLRAMVQVNQRAMQAQIADDRLFLKGRARIGIASHFCPKVRVAPQALAHGRDRDIEIFLAQSHR